MEGRKDVSIRRLKIMGLVGERFDGYLGIVVPEVDDAIRQKIEQLNNERLQQYQKIASQTQSTPLREIERQAGSAFIEREKAGFYILTEKGTWKKK